MGAIGRCGKCEKCLRSIFSFLATGNPVPSCFPEFSELSMNLKAITIKSEGTRSHWKQILECAKKNDVNGPWLKQVDRLIKRRPIIDIVLPKGSYRRLVVKSVVSKISRQ